MRSTPIAATKVELAERRLRAAKAACHADRADTEAAAAYEAAAAACVTVRSAWRTQEVGAGRRAGMVGGDAVRGSE